jgi:hypothetical protein
MGGNDSAIWKRIDRVSQKSLSFRWRYATEGDGCGQLRQGYYYSLYSMQWQNSAAD